jgi:hypothetical protein
MTLAEQIRAHLNHPGSFPGTSASNALLAVVERCELIQGSSERVGATFADSFLELIARELGINPEESR